LPLRFADGHYSGVVTQVPAAVNDSYVDDIEKIRGECNNIDLQTY